MMTAIEFPAANPRLAAAIVDTIEVSDAARACLAPEMSAAAFFNALVRNSLFKDAVSFLAHWLPPREAIWWGCECVWNACRPEPSSLVDAALGAAVAWVLEPTEEHRRAAEIAGRAASLRTPAGAVALAAAWTGGNFSSYDKAPLKPPPGISARTVATAVGFIALDGPANKMPQRDLQLLRIGTEVAQGENRWTAAEAAV